jgi:hypothetical protein
MLDHNAVHCVSAAMRLICYTPKVNLWWFSRSLSFALHVAGLFLVFD